jgi:hypothetical protein
MLRPLFAALLDGHLGYLTASYDHGYNSFAWGSSLLVLAIMLFLFNRTIARWLIPVQTPVCPGCGYSLEHLKEGRRPECGLVSSPRVADQA